MTDKQALRRDLNRLRSRINDIWDEQEGNGIAIRDRRVLLRPLRRLRAAILDDPDPGPSEGKIARMLKHEAFAGGYPWTSFALPGWSRDKRMQFLEARAEAGDSAVIFCARTLSWPSVFHGVPGWPQQPYDLYETPEKMHALVADMEQFGLEPLPALMSNTETGPWPMHYDRIVRGLRDWSHLFNEVCLGIEANIYFGQWDRPAEVHISDALMSDDNSKPLGLKVLFPDLDWAWHGQGWRHVRGADVYWHQWDWDSHRMSKEDFQRELRDVKRQAEAMGQRFFAAEAAQHREATEEDADRLRGWVLEVVEDVGF